MHTSFRKVNEAGLVVKTRKITLRSVFLFLNYICLRYSHFTLLVIMSLGKRKPWHWVKWHGSDHFAVVCSLKLEVRLFLKKPSGLTFSYVHITWHYSNSSYKLFARVQTTSNKQQILTSRGVSTKIVLWNLFLKWFFLWISFTSGKPRKILSSYLSMRILEESLKEHIILVLTRMPGSGGRSCQNG